jgi:hypothetical protein
MEYSLGVATIAAVTLSVGLPESCRVASRGYSWLNLECWVRVAMAGVGLPASCIVASLGSCTLLWNLESVSRQQASPRSASASVVSRLLLAWFGIWSRRRDAQRGFDNVVSYGMPRLTYGILCRRPFANLVSCGIPRLMCFGWFHVSASRRLSSPSGSSIVLSSRATETIFAGDRTQERFSGCDLCSVMSSSKRTNFVFAPFFCRT